jgi:hypothetical protein
VPRPLDPPQTTKYGISRVQSDGKSDDKVIPAGKSTE